MHGMKPEYEKELRRLTPRQREIVMSGLIRKLKHHEETGRLSYAYEVCPVCKDIGSTLEHKRCEQCYIEKSCQAPFTDGFRNDTAKGVAYFGEMFNVLNANAPPYTVIVGGTWDEDGGKPSKIIAAMAEELRAKKVYNGGHIKDLPTDDLRAFPLVIWMPKIPNEAEKRYPIKAKGAVLVCSKVMREGYTRADSVSRIFKMHANAVIEVHWEEQESGRWKCLLGLRDAMANWWSPPSAHLPDVVQGIMELYHWTKGSIRVGSVRVDWRGSSDLQRLMELTHQVADQVENSIGERYFGNVSTRCQSLFPGMRESRERVLISPRNTDKRRLGVDDMVLVDIACPSNRVHYYGDRKPSVDTPVQLWVFRGFHEINFMIHGHAYVKGARVTDEYYPCGDMREAYAISGLIEAGLAHHHCGIINLRNHGFLLYSQTIEGMSELVANLEIEEPN
jgi:hypothetical protein